MLAVRIIPVETRNIRERFEKVLLEDNPDIVIALSQMGGRTALSMERVAVNVLDFEFPDNVGVMRKGDVVSRGGPTLAFRICPSTGSSKLGTPAACPDTSRIRPARSSGIKRCTKFWA
jgi:pyroglutamyl-peptidase